MVNSAALSIDGSESALTPQEYEQPSAKDRHQVGVCKTHIAFRWTDQQKQTLSVRLIDNSRETQRAISTKCSESWWLRQVQRLPIWLFRFVIKKKTQEEVSPPQSVRDIFVRASLSILQLRPDVNLANLIWKKDYTYFGSEFPSQSQNRQRKEGNCTFLSLLFSFWLDVNDLLKEETISSWKEKDENELMCNIQISSLSGEEKFKAIIQVFYIKHKLNFSHNNEQ